MKTIVGKKALSMLAAALMALMLPVVSLAADLPQTNTTTATVSFRDGDLELGGGVSGSGLNFDFGEHVIPVVAESYPAKNTDGGMPVNHVLPVEDARYASGNWHVTVALSAFQDAPVDPTSSFDGMISLKNAVAANTNASAGTTGLSVENDIAVASGASAVLVMSADNTLPRGVFTATWSNDDVELNVSDSEVIQIGPSAYAATLTWTLSQGPF